MKFQDKVVFICFSNSLVFFFYPKQISKNQTHTQRGNFVKPCEQEERRVDWFVKPTMTWG